MLDYQGITALYAVIETQGFESAAKKLFITQSAVSQRIKNLENYYGEPLLIRAQPYRPTELGQSLLNHFRRVMLLEDNLYREIDEKKQTPKISIAISRDSLETWFVDVVERLKKLPIGLQIIADDQDITLEYLRKGLVSACVSISDVPINGCKSEFLGFFDYVLVASPEFKKKYFGSKKPSTENLIQAPSVIFDARDHLQHEYLERFFNITDRELNHHVVPSVAGFRQFAINGYAYALIPKIQIMRDLQQKKLLNLFPDKIWDMPLYWHTWNLSDKTYDQFSSLVKSTARKLLRTL